MEKIQPFINSLSEWSGKIFSWCVLILTLIVCYDVVMRYLLNNQTQWGFDVAYILYGTMFMMAGAYTLSRGGHVRADMVYRTLAPRTQAWFDLVLYFLFFLPGIVALVYAGLKFAGNSIANQEVSSVTSSGVPIYPFKVVIPVAGFLLLLQGFSEINRCIVCIKTGQWPSRPDDVDEDNVDELKKTLDNDDQGRRAKH